MNEQDFMTENNYSNQDLCHLFKRAARLMIRGRNHKGQGRPDADARCARGMRGMGMQDMGMQGMGMQGMGMRAMHGKHGHHGMHGPQGQHGPNGMFGPHGPHHQEDPGNGYSGRGPHGPGPAHGLHHPAQGRILSILKEKGSMNRKELLELLDVRSGSLSELLGKLERHGFISRMQDENDKRGFVILLTEEGGAMVEEHDKWRTELADTLFSPLSAEERDQLGGILAKLADAWEEASNGAGESSPENRCGQGRSGMGGRGRGRGHGRGEGRGFSPREMEPGRRGVREGEER